MIAVPQPSMAYSYATVVLFSMVAAQLEPVETPYTVEIVYFVNDVMQLPSDTDSITAISHDPYIRKSYDVDSSIVTATAPVNFVIESPMNNYYSPVNSYVARPFIREHTRLET
jgi:hypothetical protein